jgi:hypothetical protein
MTSEIPPTARSTMGLDAGSLVWFVEGMQFRRGTEITLAVHDSQRNWSRSAADRARRTFMHEHLRHTCDGCGGVPAGVRHTARPAAAARSPPAAADLCEACWGRRSPEERARFAPVQTYAAAKVRKTPRWPRSWANFRFL